MEVPHLGGNQAGEEPVQSLGDNERSEPPQRSRQLNSNKLFCRKWLLSVFPPYPKTHLWSSCGWMESVKCLLSWGWGWGAKERQKKNPLTSFRGACGIQRQKVKDRLPWKRHLPMAAVRHKYAVVMQSDWHYPGRHAEIVTIKAAKPNRSCTNLIAELADSPSPISAGSNVLPSPFCPWDWTGFALLHVVWLKMSYYPNIKILKRIWMSYNSRGGHFSLDWGAKQGQAIKKKTMV